MFAVLGGPRGRKGVTDKVPYYVIVPGHLVGRAIVQLAKKDIAPTRVVDSFMRIGVNDLFSRIELDMKIDPAIAQEAIDELKNSLEWS